MSNAQLLDLGDQLSKAWEIEKAACASDLPDDAVSSACEAASLIVAKIETLKAGTLDELKVKAKAFLWCRGVETYTDCMGDETADFRLIGSILDDLQNIGGSA